METQRNMGVDCGDIDGDGALDFFTTTFSNELPALYRNDGLGNFTDATIERGAGVNLLPHANWERHSWISTTIVIWTCSLQWSYRPERTSLGLHNILESRQHNADQRWQRFFP